MKTAQKLSWRFDTQPVLEELEQMHAPWQPHFNKTVFEGDWSGISLVEPAQDAHGIFPGAGMSSPYRKTGLYSAFPSIQEILEKFECEMLSVRLLRLAPGAEIKEHKDLDLSFFDGLVRLHIPIITNDQVEFYSDDTLLKMLPGECWFVEFARPHRVKNNGETDRIHLVIDLQVNEWLKSWFEKEGVIEKNERKPDPADSYSDQQRIAMVLRFKSHFNPTSDEMAVEMMTKYAMRELMFAEAARLVLFTGNDHFQIRIGIDLMYDLYSKQTGIEIGDLTHQKMIETENGKIVTPRHAAFCLKEYLRTTQFLRGINLAIEQRLKRKGKIRILYAGCGPYATLLTPFTAVYSPEQVSFTLLDFNPVSVEAVTALYDAWNLNDYIEKTMVADATSPELELDDDYDIIISETMQNGLNNECQVPLTRNMVRFLNPEGTFIPQNVMLDAYMVGPKDALKPKEAKKVLVGRVYDLDYRNVPEVGYEVTRDIPDTEYEYLTLYTEIQVFEQVKLLQYDTSLTVPLIKARLVDKPKKATFKYVESEKPGIVVSYERT